MEKSLQDTCRDAKLEQHITAQEIADQSGVPLSSVNNFFASTSKAPGVCMRLAPSARCWGCLWTVTLAL